MSLFQFMIFTPFIFALFIPLLYYFFNKRLHIGWLVMLVPLGLFVYLLQFISPVRNGENIHHTLSWIPSLGMNFTTFVDGLNLIYGLLITGMGTLVVLYSIYYMSREREELHKFYIYLFLFMGAMLGVVFSDNILVLYVFWELTSISSFLLIAYWYERKASRSGALKALLITVTGGFCMFAGFIMMIQMSGTYSIREMFALGEVIVTHPLFIPAMILILIGAFSKSAQFPFGIWLPDAMEAPTPVSAYLHSATMVKAGIYLVARLMPIFGGNAIWFWTISLVGIFTLLYGSVTAVRQTDLKALLAYSTISQLGLIMSLLGIGSYAYRFEESSWYVVFSTALLAAIFHLFNHSAFKGSLFMVVGIIDHETGTRDIRRLGGLMNIMPVTFTIALIGTFSMAGLPPFSGFLSKEMFFEALYEITHIQEFNLNSLGMIFPVVAWIASVFTFIYSMIVLLKTFTGKYQPKKLNREVHEAPFGMLISPMILAGIVILTFFIPNVLAKNILHPALFAILPQARGNEMGEISAWHGFTPALWMTIGVVLVGIVLYRTLRKWQSAYHLYPQNFTLNALYNRGIAWYESFSQKLTDRYMTGSLRGYLIYILIFFVVVIGGAFLAFGNIPFEISNNAPVSIYELTAVIAIVFASISLLLTNNRITAIVSLGAVGFMVVMLFVIFRAPDLALTQMVVETVTTILFLLCFYHLPELKKRMNTMKFKLTNAVIAFSVGTLVTVFSLAAFNHKLFEPISYFFENAYELAHAKNIVNATLVDFRGFDTMLEISVLTIAGLGVYTLIRVRSKEGNKNETAE